MSRKQITEEIRLNYLEKISSFFRGEDEDVLRVKSNEIAFPVVGSDGSEEFVVVTVKVPNGSKDEPYDGYAMAEDYEIHQREKEEKKKKRGEEKERKIARDKRMREKKKEIAEKAMEKLGWQVTHYAADGAEKAKSE